MNGYQYKYFSLLLWLLSGLFIISGCRNKPAIPVTITIQPFSDIAAADAKSVYNELKKIYPFVEMKPAISLPPEAYYKPRNRYKADILIKYLSSRAESDKVVIGLTSKDISTKKNDVEDWGVMGLGYCPGDACVASTFRLTPGHKLNQLFKVSIHEIGHTQGLEHCDVKTCFMRDAEGRNPTNEEVEFCKNCLPVLEKKGWKFGK